MATSNTASVKCLNTSSGSKRFVFKRFSQRVEEINIDVFRSLAPVKSEPSTGSSFFRESLIQWRELNTAEDFISFYEEMMPLVQTLPQIILHREKIFSKLLDRLSMRASLSLQPILMLIAALSRDILEEFLPFLERLTKSTVDLLEEGGKRDPEILEQVFTSWSYIMMYLQKYLVKGIINILKVTVQLRFFPEDYVREFMAEAVSFLLRNAPENQLIADDIKQIAVEVRDRIRDVIGVDNFVRVYNQIRENLKRKRESRRQAGQVLAVVNPTRHAKRKIRVAAKHRAHKRKKIMNMKMGRWRR